MVSCRDRDFDSIADRQGIQSTKADDKDELPLPPEARRRFDDVSRTAWVYQGQLPNSLT